MNEKSTLTDPAVKLVHINLDFFVHFSNQYACISFSHSCDTPESTFSRNLQTVLYVCGCLEPIIMERVQ